MVVGTCVVRDSTTVASCVVTVVRIVDVDVVVDCCTAVTVTVLVTVGAAT